MGRRVLAGALAIGAPVVVVGALFLSLYTPGRDSVPVGSDTTQYMWRAKAVEAGGADAIPKTLPYPLTSQADRPGYPALASMLDAVTGATPFRLAYVIPAVMAAVIGLAAAALAACAIGEPRWAFPVYAVVVGASVNVALTANGYIDNLVIDGILLAAAAAALLAADGAPAIAAAIFLVVGGVAVHPVFVVLFGGLLLGAVLLFLPESIRRRREGTGILATPSGRLAGILGGALPLAGGVSLILPALPAGPKNLLRVDQLRKLRDQVPWYHFPMLGPSAAAGVAAVAVPPRPNRIRGLAFLLLWALSPVPAVALLSAGGTFPAQRVLDFALAIPFLVAAALVGAARLTSLRMGTAGRVIGALVVLAGLAGTMFLARQAWYSRQQAMPLATLEAVMEAGRYVATAPSDRPVVFVIDRAGAVDHGTTPAFRRLRAFMPNDRVDDVFTYPGDVQHALAGVPMHDPERPGLNRLADLSWVELRHVFARDPILVAVEPYYDGFKELSTEHPSWRLGSQLAIARGPSPAAFPAVHVDVPPSQVALAGSALAVLAVLLGTGVGWSASLFPGTWLGRVAVAPAFGIAAMVLAGLVADRLGFSLSGGSGVAIVVLAAATGWGPILLRFGRSTRSMG